MSVDNEIKKLIIDAFGNYVNEYFRVQKIDQTILGKIISDLGSGNYTVEINGENENIHAMDSSIKTYSVNDIVWITIPLGNNSDKFILGKKI